MENSSKYKERRPKRSIRKVDNNSSISEIRALNSKYSEILIECLKEQQFKPMMKLISNMGPAELNEILILMLEMTDSSKLKIIPVYLAESIFDHVIPACSTAKQEDCFYLMMQIAESENIERDVLQLFFTRLAKNNPITQKISLHAISRIARREQILAEEQKKMIEQIVWNQLSNPDSTLHLCCLECLFIDYVFVGAEERIVECLMNNLEHLPRSETLKTLQWFVSAEEIADKVLKYINFGTFLSVSFNEEDDTELLNLINLIVRIKLKVPEKIKEYLVNKCLNPDLRIMVELGKCVQTCFLVSQNATMTEIYEKTLSKCAANNPEIAVKMMANCLGHIKKKGVKVRHILKGIDKDDLTDSRVADKYSSLLSDNSIVYVLLD